MGRYNSQVTDGCGFYEGLDPFSLVRQFGSPLYLYNERLLRNVMREFLAMCPYPRLQVNFSAKANSNLAILQIAKQEGLSVDAMSPGEITMELAAGYQPEDILLIANNVSEEEMSFAQDRGVKISVDSLSQLERFGRLFPGEGVALRINPGIGAGHHEKVITGGSKTKFGINREYIPELKQILSKYKLRLAGINQHIGSLFMEDAPYLEAFSSITEIASHFPGLEFIDLGGGFGIPYGKQKGEKRLNLKSLGEKLSEFMFDFAKNYGSEPYFKLEPGRYIAAECGILLGSCNAVKNNGPDKYIGTDIGFNVLARPAMYGASHEIEVYRNGDKPSTRDEKVTIVGNICETGDIIAKDVLLPEIFEGDTLGVLDAGAYGYCMSSNYNNRLRPAEVFINLEGNAVLARKRDELSDLYKGFEGLY